MSILKSLIVVGDRVLIEPNQTESQTGSGLYLPASVKEKAEISTGKILRVGPGYPIPVHQDPEDFYQDKKEPVQYIPLQAKEGDEVLYLKKNAFEIEYEGKKFVIVPQNAILLIIRDALADLNL